jgi:[ribosomal protein S5]-alanine N-acetyltransferase
MSEPPAATLPLLTQRLRLRALSERDLDALVELYSDPFVDAMVGPHTRAEVEQELRFHLAHQAEHGWAMWAVEELATGELIGACGLQPLELRGPEVELGYDLRSEVWGQGFATEAARATLDFALGALRIERVIAVVKPTNVASYTVLEKVGMSFAGWRHAYEEELMLYETARG